jgi:hypothetical protein
MSRTLHSLTTVFLVFLAIVILGGLGWANTRYASDNVGEKDFFVPWLAARTFLKYGDNPYGDPAAQRAQVVYYGRLADVGEDPLRLSVPFPVELFYFPFGLIPDYALARGLWMTCLEISLIALAFLSIHLTGWKPARTLLPVILIFSVLWIFGFLPIAASNAVIFVALAIAVSLLAIRDERDELAGALLVFPFFKPEIAGLLVLFVLWWAVYHHRGRILAGFFMALAILVALSFFILLNWFMPFIGGLISHVKYQPGFTPGGIFTSWWPALGSRLGWLLTAVMAVVFFLEWRAVRHKEFRHFLWTVSLTLAGAPLIGIPVNPHDFVLLFFPLILFLAILAERWSRPGRWGVSSLVLLVTLFGFWLSDAGLVVAGHADSLNAVLALVLPVILVLGLYWMRWWAVRPPRTWSDSLP